MILKAHNYHVVLQCFFRFRALNSDGFFGLTHANFEANSAIHSYLTQNQDFEAKSAKSVLTQPKS